MGKAAAKLAQKRLNAAIMRNRRRIEQTQQQQLAKALRDYFLGLRGRLKLPSIEEKSLHFDVISLKVRELKTEPASSFPSADKLLSWADEDRRMTAVVQKAYVNVGDDVRQGIQDALGVTLDMDLKRAFDKGVLAEIGTSVKAINDTTRDTIQGIVGRGLEDGSSPSTIAKELIGSIEGWGGGKSGETIAHSRAMVVARTETAIAYNRSAVLAAKESGIIEQMECLDSPECGWDGHDDPEAANGKIVTLDEAMDNPVSHPNCVRAYAPVVASFAEAAEAPDGTPLPK